jgi:hypothetical protein
MAAWTNSACHARGVNLTPLEAILADGGRGRVDSGLTLTVCRSAMMMTDTAVAHASRPVHQSVSLEHVSRS